MTSTTSIPIRNRTIELSEPENITLLVKIPAADPPVDCYMSTTNAWFNGTGAQTVDVDLKFNVVFDTVIEQVINVTLEYIAYKSWTTQFLILIKGELDVKTTTLVWQI